MYMGNSEIKLIWLNILYETRTKNKQGNLITSTKLTKTFCRYCICTKCYKYSDISEIHIY